MCSRVKYSSCSSHTIVLKSPGIDSKESISLAFVAGGPGRPSFISSQFLAPIDCSKIPALDHVTSSAKPNPRPRAKGIFIYIAADWAHVFLYCLSQWPYQTKTLVRGKDLQSCDWILVNQSIPSVQNKEPVKKIY